MKVAVLGRTHLLLKSARALAAAGHKIVAVGTADAAPEYRADTEDFRRFASETGAAFFAGRIGPEEKRVLTELGAEVAVSINWPTILPTEVRGLFRHGVINAHAGDLPRYRGNACPNWAILAGEDEVVLTLHLMDDRLDSGAILLKRRLALDENTYIADVYAWSEAILPGLFVEAVDGLADGSIVPEPQPSDPKATLRTYPRLPQDGIIDFSRSATHLARLVRASGDPFPGAFTHLEGARVTIHRAHAARLDHPYLGVPGQVVARTPEQGTVTVLCGDGVLVLEEVALENGPRSPAATILRSLRMRLGMQPEKTITELREAVTRLEARLKRLEASTNPHDFADQAPEG